MASQNRFNHSSAHTSMTDVSTLHEYAGPAKGADQHLAYGSRGLTPYMGLRSRLSQVWINRWTVLLFLVLARTLISVASLQDGIDNAHKDALAACTSVENVGSALASSPHYMAAGINAMTAASVTKAVHALYHMLDLIITGAEELLVFVINTLTGTYLCLITLAVAGSLHVALDLIEDVSGFLNSTLNDIGKEFADGVGDFNSALNKAVSGINDIGSAFGSKHSIPTLDLSKQEGDLSNVHIPASFTADIQQLNSSIPTFAQVQNLTDNVIRLPFEEIKKLINQSLPNYQFNRSAFPVPQKEKLSFCSNNSDITKFFQKLIDLELTARRVAIAVLVLLAVLVCIPMAVREVRRYRFQQERAQIVGSNLYEPMDVVYIVSRPYTSSAGIWLSGKVRSGRLKTLIRWVVAYATSAPALVVLSLGLAGLFSCLCQYLVVKVVQREVPELAQEVGAFADHVVRSLENASERWANGTNTVILDTNHNINQDVFGWVNISTTALNDTLNTFTDETIKVLNATFGGTVLYDPITEVFNCLIGLKIAGIEKGLTWIQDHAHVDFPLMPNDTFSLGASGQLTGDDNANAMLTDPGGDATGTIAGGLEKLVNKTLHAIRNEALIAGTVVLVYVIMVLIGVGRASWLLFRGERADEVVVVTDSYPHGPLGGGSHSGEKAPGGIEMNASGGRFAEFPVATAPLVGSSEGAAANQYKGVSYTIQPRPFQPGGGGGQGGGAQVGYAGARDVSQATMPASDRRSQYPEIATGRSPAGGATQRLDRSNFL